VILPQESVEAIWQAIEATPRTAITVDLETRTVSYNDVTIAFELDDYTRWRLMEGLDDIGLTLNHTDSIDAFEAKRPAYKPTTLPIRI
jgi:3-isopropylmalate/(R)-2-methylmalate dehydratase small subunit